MTINIIDPHLHLFNRSLGDYHWLNSENPPFWPDKSLLQRDFTIKDLAIDNLTSSLTQDKIKLAGFVHIEAGFDNTKPWRELEYLDNLAMESGSCKKSRTVASINLLTTPLDFNQTLDKLQQHASMIGVRHILDEQAYSTLANHNTQRNFARLNEVTGLVFELQLSLADESAKDVMPLLRQTIANNSQLSFIINHAGFPPTEINSDAWRLWQKHITTLAKYANVFIKCSGWEMTDRQYKMSWFSAVSNFCIGAFSIERVMLASNFPLCLLGNKLANKVGKKLGNKSYQDYWRDILESTLIKQCSKKEKNALLYDNALKIYQL
ncbi:MULTISPECIES: amidohydrolase family protein [Colwellia]|uniref:Amidohydrolase n=1 Tax=Colwellia marinimaniae TaxID=1513592 RepID=A0ABQ0MT52_9GAMM|nr:MULTISPECIES: amidohydrolase family protein [Colwellia]GAW94796.1 amidohydrolase [Colwellia marinimaniae]